ncbi:MAG: hypothetical protein Q6373_008170 [Candidatus Sigynarchaeota archaeon]
MNEDQARTTKFFPFAHALRHGMFVLVIFGGLLTGLGIYFNIGQARYATILYHYNAEYRAGNQAVEDAIINVAIPELIKMYDRHPDWPWTLELQAWAIVNMSLTNNGTIFNMLKNQINRGQCELITPLWSYQMLTAFTLDDVNISLALTRETLSGLGISRFPRVCFFQESQAFPGFGNAIFKHYGFDTCMVGTHVLALHGIEPVHPLFIQRLWNDPSTDFFYLPYNWVPETVQDGFHFWTFLATGETVTGRNVLTSQGTGQGEEAYLPAPELIAAHELRLDLMRKSGYRMMTISDYITTLVNRHEYAMLGRFVPETTWRDMPGFGINREDSNGLWKWMAHNTAKGNATNYNDDGSQLADTWRTGIILKATRTLLLANWNNLVGTRETLNATLTNAYKFYFRAQGTDAYGWEPSWIVKNVLHETDYSRRNNHEARLLALQVLQSINSTLALGNLVQIYTENMTVGAGTAAFSQLPASFINETRILTGLGLNDLPLEMSLGLEGNTSAPTVTVYNCTWGGFTYQTVDIDIPTITASRLKLASSYPLWYCPTFYEDRAMQFSFYGEEPFALPIANGLVFLGSETSGIAIIKNNSARHVALLADRDWIGYYEETDEDDPYPVKNVHYSFVIYQGTLETANALANFINTRPYVKIDMNGGWA